MFRVVIPARYASTRLPGKPLSLIAGRPMIEHVHARALGSGAGEVWIATDDVRIEAAARKFGGRAVMTSPAHASGTDRIAEVAARLKWAEEDIVVNVQGDEPLLPSALISQVAALLAATPQADIATLATPIETLGEFLDGNVVKVVMSTDALALYFSRAPIPWSREGASQGWGSQVRFDGALRHLGLYAYRVRALRRLASLPPAVLEQTERLEQLRALAHGMRIAVGIAMDKPGPGVDTEEDLANVARMLEQQGDSGL